MYGPCALVAFVVTLALALSGCGSSDCAPARESWLPAGECGNIVEQPSGVAQPLEGVYAYLEPAPLDGELRALIGLSAFDRDVLAERISAMYDPANPSFRRYLSREQWMDEHAPRETDVAIVERWLSEHGMEARYRAANRLLLYVVGTVEQFNEAFATELHVCERDNPAAGGDPYPVYCILEPLRAPRYINERIYGVVTVDLPAEEGELRSEAGNIITTLPDEVAEGYGPPQIAAAYRLAPLHEAGHRGAGVTIGVVVGATFRFKDLQSFWQSFGITRNDPTVVEVAEPIVTRYRETTLDVQWAGAMAPDADLIVYAGPDARNASIIFAFNEAIGRAEASVVTTSFAHREDGEPRVVREQHHEAAMMAAALGITVISAGGDSAQPDVPATSPYVTSVGGTSLSLASDGTILAERAWSASGSGDSLTFARPDWQAGVVAGDKRAVSDVALHASVDPAPYWIYYLQEWRRYGGTSFSAPVFAGMIAVINDYRNAQGMPPVGFLNSLLYTDPEVQSAFGDITSGQTEFHMAAPGWDYPTGWGSPRAWELAQALP